MLSKQLLRCGTSVGANVSEAEKAQTKADFYTKMTIALKEGNETDYWLRLLVSITKTTKQDLSKSKKR